MGLFRCRAEGCESDGEAFESNERAPVCSACGNEECKAIEAVHYLVIAADGPIRTGDGRRSIACAPKEKKLPPHCTGERTAATCPACRASAVFAQHEQDRVDQHRPILDKQILEAARAG
jgi:hypothetical protein